MSAGARNSNGKPKDIVRHFKLKGANMTLCGRKKWGYASDDKEDVSCYNCLKKMGLAKPDVDIANPPKDIIEQFRDLFILNQTEDAARKNI